MIYVPNDILVRSFVYMLYVVWLLLHFSVKVLYDIIVLLFVCMLYVVWLVLDGSLCRGALLLSSYPQYIMSGFDVA